MTNCIHQRKPPAAAIMLSVIYHDTFISNDISYSNCHYHWGSTNSRSLKLWSVYNSLSLSWKFRKIYQLPYIKLVEIWCTESHFMFPLCNIDWRLFLTMISYLSLQKIFLQTTRHAHVLKLWQVIDSLLVKCQGNASSA